MNLLPPSDTPRVFALPPGADFARAFAAGLRDRLRHAPPEALARMTVAVNTRRTARSMIEAFEAAGGAVFLPRIATLDSFARGEAAGPPVADKVTRLLSLTRLAERFLTLRPEIGPATPTASAALAESLAALLDECQRERVALDTLRDAFEADRYAAHWETMSAFFAHVAAEWPGVLAHDLGKAEPEAARSADTDALLARWRAEPPTGPIIAAGSTGSQRLTADLLEAIARAPQGALVLPGFDFGMDAEAWRTAGPDHPQYGFARLLDRLGLPRGAVEPWVEVSTNAPRARLLSQALRPAPVTHHWRAARENLSPEAGDATADVTLIEAPDPRREAEAIALVIRAELSKPDADVALVTPDRPLARRVAAALARWGIEPDDSAGVPLSLTPPGVLLELTANVLARPFDPVALLALLKHPLVAGGEDEARAAHHRAVEAFEVKALRNRDAALSIDSVAMAAAAKDRHGESVVADALRDLLLSLAPWESARPLAEMIDAHIAVAEGLAGGDLWDKAAGEAARGALAAFREAAAIYGDAAAADYPALLRIALKAAGDVRDEAYRGDARVRVLGPLEARAQSARLMILGGLNEGIWPPAPPVDPWLNRPMRAALGLTSPERRIGLSAHDFMQAASAPRVILTRPLRSGGAPTVEARWLTRLRTLLDGLGMPESPVEAMRARGAGWLTAAKALDMPDLTGTGIPRPRPTPPVAARPREISVTDVEKLIRDPYEVYARRVLKLYPLETLGVGPDARLRGEVLHRVMELFVDRTKDAWPADPAPLFDELAEEAIAEAVVPPAEAVIWRARLERVKPWFLETEAARRTLAAPLGTELDGKMPVPTVAGDVTLKGRADRIDRIAGGGLAIYDYKAGATPTQKQVEIFAKQLPLLAAMAEAGVIADTPAERAEILAYLSLSGAGAGGKEVPVEATDDTLAGLTALLNEFFDAETPYLPRAYVEHSLGYGSDYAHLYRLGEWIEEIAETAPPGTAR